MICLEESGLLVGWFVIRSLEDRMFGVVGMARMGLWMYLNHLVVALELFGKVMYSD